MIEQDTIKLLRECDSGIKMGVASIDEVLPFVHNKEFKELLETCKKEHEKLDRETQELLDKYHDDGKCTQYTAGRDSTFAEDNAAVAFE